MLAGVLVLSALPGVIGRLPAGHSQVSPATLLTRVQASADVAYSGYAESTGALDLPVSAGQFGSLSDLFGGSTQLRVWSRSSLDWRVDQISATGETDRFSVPDGIWSWNYEADTATLDFQAAGVAVRLPRADDLLPANLARRLLSQATPTQVSRLADARIAGRDAAGLRYTPAAAQSTIAHVDVWALAATGLVLKVQVFGRAEAVPVVATSMLDVSISRPAASVTAFVPPPHARIQQQNAPDIVAFINQLGRVTPPRQLAGLARADQNSGLGAVGVYGQGVTRLVAIPLFDRTADQLRAQLSRAVGASTAGTGAISIGVGPLNLLLAAPEGGPGEGSSWLLVGTVSAATLTTAQAQLPQIGDR